MSLPIDLTKAFSKGYVRLFQLPYDTPMSPPVKHKWLILNALVVFTTGKRGCFHIMHKGETRDYIVFPSNTSTDMYSIFQSNITGYNWYPIVLDKDDEMRYTGTSGDYVLLCVLEWEV
jgi:hypothetical protein